jgi:hypothetical protein
MNVIFETHGVASHELNARSGERVLILGRVDERIGEDDVPLYHVMFEDGHKVEAFATELFLSDGRFAR